MLLRLTIVLRPPFSVCHRHSCRPRRCSKTACKIGCTVAADVRGGFCSGGFDRRSGCLRPLHSIIGYSQIEIRTPDEVIQ